jgi:hypothetical protein
MQCSKNDRHNVWANDYRHFSTQTPLVRTNPAKEYVEGNSVDVIIPAVRKDDFENSPATYQFEIPDETAATIDTDSNQK